MNRIRVGISGLPLGNRGGTGYYTEQLLRVLSERGDSRFELTVLPVGGTSLSLRWPFQRFADRVFGKHPEGFDLIHYPNGVGPPISSKPLVATLHDISPFICPETFPKATAIYLRKVFYNVYRRTKVLLTDSHWQAEKIRGLWPEAEEKLRVVSPTLSPTYRLPPPHKPNVSPHPNPYFLMVGTLEPRKRVDLGIQSWEESNVPVDLCLVGRWGWMTEDIRRTLKRVGPMSTGPSNEQTWTLPDGRAVHHLQGVETRDLIELYRHAVALVYPSQFEGFGLPVLEAMTLGCPVLTRRASAMEEIVGSAGWFFEEDSKQALASTMEELFRKSDMRHGRAVAGRELSKGFSDERFFEGIAAAYESAVGG